MKKYILIILCTTQALNCMETSLITNKAREWDPKKYKKGNSLQSAAFSHFMTTNNICIKNKIILDVGCGLGNLSAEFAQEAEHVHGIDASKNMIIYGKKHYNKVPNLSLEHCCAENFKPQRVYHVAIASFSIPWFHNQQQAFQCINNSLEIGGDFFATVSVNNCQRSTNFINAIKAIPKLETIIISSAHKDITDLIGTSYPSYQELDNMLEETGFEIIKRNDQCFDYIMPNKKKITYLLWPIISSRPFMDYVPQEYIAPLVKAYTDIVLSKMRQNDKGEFLYKLRTTIVHARKIKK